MIDDYIRKILVKASRDYNTAETLLKFSTGLDYTEAICFHAQQAIEKFLKAYLINKDVNIPRTHNLDYLLQKCIEIDERFAILNVDNITDYAVDIRYTDDFYIPDYEEANNALKKASKVRRFVLDIFSISDEELKLF
jgi:HEPN domain-containing protein